MKIIGIVSEFNPFHNGHKYLLDYLKRDNDCIIVAVMSGNFVQRGELAITGKYSRTKVALENGTDLVLELPAPYSLSRTELFAKHSIEILNNIGITHLAFGSECTDKDLLLKCSKAESKYENSPEVKELMNNGLSFPKALQKIVSENCGNEVASILEGSNNILATNYIKYLAPDIDFIPIKRTGAMHDSENTSHGFASASKIRKLISENENYSDFVPSAVQNISDASKIYNSVFLKIRSLNSKELLNYEDVSVELADRFVKSARISTDFDEFLMNVKTRRYPLARIKRICLCVFLGITKNIIDYKLPYIRILGMNDNGKYVLSRLPQGHLPINTSLSQLSALNTDAKLFADICSHCDDIFNFTVKKPLPAGSDFKSMPIIL